MGPTMIPIVRPSDAHGAGLDPVRANFARRDCHSRPARPTGADRHTLIQRRNRIKVKGALIQSCLFIRQVLDSSRLGRPAPRPARSRITARHCGPRATLRRRRRSSGGGRANELPTLPRRITVLFHGIPALRTGPDASQADFRQPGTVACVHTQPVCTRWGILPGGEFGGFVRRGAILAHFRGHP
jgi:hypothetical protein